jgi:hypothetical protein
MLLLEIIVQILRDETAQSLVHANFTQRQVTQEQKNAALLHVAQSDKAKFSHVK